jgi:hypothetical protein
MPFSFILMILSIPEIKFSSFIKNLIPIAFVISFISLTAVVWKAFEAEEMSGVKDVINTVENDSKILTLSFQTDSSFVQGRAFIQMFAYCQVVKKGELNFSFADFKPSLVVYKTPRQYYWTNGLEWLPQYFKLPDALYFDYLITSGDKDVYNKFSNAPFFTPLTNSKKWNIFKINKNKIYSFIKSRENNGPVKAVEN